MRSLIAVMAALLIAAAGCSTGGCYDNQSAIPLAQFYDAATGTAITVSGVRIYGIGAPHDSTLIRPTQSISQVYLPMRSQYTSTAWCFEAETADSVFVSDTIAFEYTAKPYFASEECGAMYWYEITSYSYTRHVIDSVAVTDSLITNADIPTIEIYYRTASKDEGDQGTEGPAI